MVLQPAVGVEAALVVAVAELGERARKDLAEPDAELSVSYELRYRGQNDALEV